MRDHPRLVQRSCFAVRRGRDLELGQDLGELPAVLGEIDRLRRRPEHGEALFLQGSCQSQRGLAAELGDHADGSFGAAHREHVFGREWLEVQAARRVVVGGDGLGIGIDHHRLVAGFLQRERGVHAGVVELDPLADAIGPGAKDHDARAIRGHDLGLLFVG